MAANGKAAIQIFEINGNSRPEGDINASRRGAVYGIPLA